MYKIYLITIPPLWRKSPDPGNYVSDKVIPIGTLRVRKYDAGRLSERCQELVATIQAKKMTGDAEVYGAAVRTIIDPVAVPCLRTLIDAMPGELYWVVETWAKVGNRDAVNALIEALRSHPEHGESIRYVLANLARKATAR